MATRPAIFKWRQTEPVLILSAVRWYRYSLSLRDVEELLKVESL
jgi:transposase-like protein